MNRLVGSLRRTVTGSLVAIVVASAATMAQTTYWVDANDTNASDSNSGLSSALPWKTLTHALGPSGVDPGDILKVRTADYDASTTTDGAGETFPLTVQSGVTIIGTNNSGATPRLLDYPRIGGDVGASADALLVIHVTAADSDPVQVSRLRFLGEDEAGIDSPIAIKVLAENGYGLARLVIEHNYFERPNMNGSGPGLATIHVEAHNGSIGSNSSGLISDNDIYCSDRGGIELVAAAAENQIASTNLEVNFNVVTVPQGETAEFALKWEAEYLGDPEEGDGQGYSGIKGITGNTIIGRGGIGTGIAIICPEYTSFTGNGIPVERNRISGCDGDGLVLKADGWGAGHVPEISVFLAANQLVNNGGSGLVLSWDEDGEDQGDAYMAVASEGNLIVGNQGYGIEIRGYGVDSLGSMNFSSETIADNKLGGEGYFELALEEEGGWAPNGPPSHVNCIMKDNNPYPGNGDQIIGLTTESWLSGLLANVFYCNWGDIGISETNIDVDPEFVDAPNGDFHLGAESPCIDVGFNDAADQVIDIDREDRKQDGDFDCMDDPEPVVDMGCDEVPEPDCP